MALIRCKECGCQISSKAKFCPNCGIRIRRTKTSTWIIFGIIVLLFIIYVGIENRNKNISKKPPNKVYVPSYEILKEDFVDTPSKAQIDLRVLFPHKVNEERLRALLNKLYSTVKDRGFKYYDKPTHVFIDVYTSKEKIDRADWIASLQKLGSDAEPTISINERQLALYKY